MKNIIIAALIFILPLSIYFFMTNRGDNTAAFADNTGKPSVVIFTSTMCADCKKMKEVIKTVQPEYESRVYFNKINALDSSKKVQNDIAKYNVTLVPTMVFLDKDGNEKNKVTGSMSREDFVAQLEGLIND